MKRIFLIAFIGFLTNASFAQSIVSVDSLKRYTIGELIGQGLFSAEYEVDLYKIVYNTIDVKGNPTIASGAIAIPIDPECDTLALISYNHGTVLLKEKVPSRMSGEEFVGLGSAASGAVGIMPDYLGLGDSPGFHPYQHAESEATATLDMIRASRIFLEDSLGIKLNGQVFLTGYSQGGHAAMATHKFIEENNLTQEFNVVASAPASGAYDMSGITANFVFGGAYSNPGYIVYLIEAYQLAYGNLYQTKDQFYKAPYDTVILPYLTGDSTMAQLNAVLSPFVIDLIEDSVLANYVADSVNFKHPLRRALKDNDVFDWTPQVKIEMNYCENDEQVPYQNSTKTASVMTANGASDVKATSRGVFFNHGQCVLPSLSAMQSLFLSLVDGCGDQSIGIADNPFVKSAGLNIYPNPAQDFLNIQLPEESIVKSLILKVYDTRGRLILKQQANGVSTKIQTEKFKSGLYIIHVQTDRNVYTNTVVIQ